MSAIDISLNTDRVAHGFMPDDDVLYIHDTLHHVHGIRIRKFVQIATNDNDTWWTTIFNSTFNINYFYWTATSFP
ncbi:unnamed protein product [Diabrotica balteata]|uniref:Uncharacterized protein n=1 Tax=Diabrotica balteata TaxID=107213 RepID=A0A9N9T534_DIABA|nr:unnamed protein product [Diabrotica balteata]